MSHQSEEDILAAMKQKTRYNIRLAGRKGIEIKHGTLADFPAIVQMYEETAVRDGFCYSSIRILPWMPGALFTRQA
ncbi:MAG: aminoacyltransferase [Chloroflexi bacterium]|nr:aminoacyltransferase [Chloroflexota bacterium]